MHQSTNWDTAYGWGDGAAGYLTPVPVHLFPLTGKPTTIAGYGITDAYDNTDFDTRLASKDTGDLPYCLTYTLQMQEQMNMGQVLQH